MDKTPVVLAILDGWGWSERKVGNPIAEANTPVLDLIADGYPMTLLQASGLAVGQVWGESGNSEVGHLNIGAGRIVEQYLSRINRAITDDSFFTNPALSGAFAHSKKTGGRVHAIGLLTSGTVHAAFNHLIALLDLAAKHRPTELDLHLFLDGKDSGLQEGGQLLAKLQEEIKRRGVGKITTLIGRDYAMDRDNNWELTERAYRLLVEAQGERRDDPAAFLASHYAQGQSDADLPPTVISDFDGLRVGDALIFFNFREDSMRQLVQAFVDPGFSNFATKPFNSLYVCAMTEYLPAVKLAVAFPRPEIKNGLAEWLERNDKKQFHIAETEKYAHATYFFNGLNSQPHPNETDVFINSLPDYEANPALQSLEIAKRVAIILEAGEHDFILLNFANGDLLAHTGNYRAAVTGVEAVDSALGLLKDKVLAKNGILLISADHGNVETLTYQSGQRETRHNDNPVPFYLVANQYLGQRVKNPEISGILADIAPTILELMALPQPEEMTGKSLLPVLLKS